MRFGLLLSVVLASGGPAKRTPITHVECGAPQRSLVSDKRLDLVFANHTKGAVSIYWLDFNGDRVWYNTLAPGDGYSQQTYVTHPWVIVDAKGRCLDQLVATDVGTFGVPIRRP